MSENQLVEHFFRHEYGRLVAILVRQVGVEHAASAEDAAQTALTKALEAWPYRGVPQNPAAWLYRVSRNELLGAMRQQSNRMRLIEQHASDPTLLRSAVLAPEHSGDTDEDLLHMLFVCCDEVLPRESQLVFALKTLCGFSVREIAFRLLLTEATVYKRVSRARERLAAKAVQLAALSTHDYRSRLVAVHSVLYALFSEGYLSSDKAQSIRGELCDEAIRLAAILLDHPDTQSAASHALMALMLMQRARFSARTDDSGALLLLEEQDRSRWDQSQVAQGLMHLQRSAAGAQLSRYHLEAAIAAEHCLAQSFAQTRWSSIVENYVLLEQLAPSALYTLNRAVALAEWQGPAAGLALIENTEPPQWLLQSYLWSAVKADLLLRSGEHERAGSDVERALALAPSAAIRQALKRRLAH